MKNSLYTSIIIFLCLINNFIYAESKAKFVWNQKNPDIVQINDEFQISFFVSTQNPATIAHLNIHLCPKEKGSTCSKTDGRIDGKVESGKIDSKGKIFEQTIKIPTEGEWHAIGHMYLIQDGVRSNHFTAKSYIVNAVNNKNLFND